MAEDMERVTDPAAPDPVPETTKNKRAKDQRNNSWACGAAALKAKVLEALRAAKESLRSSAAPPPPGRGRRQYSSKGPGICRQTARCSCCFAITGT